MNGFEEAKDVPLEEIKNEGKESHLLGTAKRQSL
jgi:hypothetical protein